MEAKPEQSREGSRAIVLARHSLETFARLGCGAEMVERGVVLDRARTYFRERELFCVEFPPPAAGELPRFMNLQQTHTERALLRAVEATSAIDVRWGTPVSTVTQDAAGVSLDGVRGSFAVACDGSHSTVRKLMGVEFEGRSFADRFLIADIRAELAFPSERRFFFDPPSNPGRQVLIHPQPDGEWRIDWQVTAETDAEAEGRSGRLDERIQAVIGPTPYELVWLTSYRFHQRLARRFRVGRVFLAGDAAHLMAPFGARGMNSGVEDAVNLAWKLAFVWHGRAPDRLLDTYERERQTAAKHNLAVTGATMRFMAPPTRVHRLLRNSILRASLYSRTARRLVDSGRLAEPAAYFPTGAVGRIAPPAEVREPIGDDFPFFTLAREGPTTYVIRPDGYVVAELVAADRAAVERAVRSALCLS